MMENTFSRRAFLQVVSSMIAGTAVASTPALVAGRKIRIALVGTGSRGIGFWGKRIVEHYSDVVEYVALCDVNRGRLEFAREYMGVNCPVHTDFDAMLQKAKPDLLIVATKDSTHHEYIIKGLESDCDVLTEKPLTTDEVKAQAIREAEKKSSKKVIVGFNYRWGPYMTRIKELLQKNTIGRITSVDFNWYLNMHHGSSYFRRWHGLMKDSGSLWVHKATHHFDLVNWWLDADPEEIFAYGALEHYGKNGPFRGKNCRTCPHGKACTYYYDITEDEHYMNLYVANEKYDGYLRDACVYREEIDIYDKMSAQIKYANQTVVNYSLTSYSPFEGWRIAFNGEEGRIEAWTGIPWLKDETSDQKALHALEMSQGKEEKVSREPLIVYKNGEDYQFVHVISERGGHGGGDRRLHNKIFRDPGAEDPFSHSAGLRDGIMSILVGVAARKSIMDRRPVRIDELTDIKPHPQRKSV